MSVITLTKTMNLFKTYSVLCAILNEIKSLGEKMVPISQGFTDLSNAISTLTSEEAAVVSAITALQAQVAAGSPVTGDQLEALAQSVGGVSVGLAAAIAPTPISTNTATSTATSS